MVAVGGGQVDLQRLECRRQVVGVPRADDDPGQLRLASAQASASAAIETPRSAASRSSASSASKTRSDEYPSYGSGRSVIREPAGGASPRRYLPVSHPPASGLNGV